MSNQRLSPQQLQALLKQRVLSGGARVGGCCDACGQALVGGVYSGGYGTSEGYVKGMKTKCKKYKNEDVDEGGVLMKKYKNNKNNQKLKRVDQEYDFERWTDFLATMQKHYPKYREAYLESNLGLPLKEIRSNFMKETGEIFKGLRTNYSHMA